MFVWIRSLTFWEFDYPSPLLANQTNYTGLFVLTRFLLAEPHGKQGDAHLQGGLFKGLDVLQAAKTANQAWVG